MDENQKTQNTSQASSSTPNIKQSTQTPQENPTMMVSSDRENNSNNRLKSIMTLSVVAIMILAIPVTMLLVNQRQDIRQRASEVTSPPNVCSGDKALRMIQEGQGLIVSEGDVSLPNLTVEMWAKSEYPQDALSQAQQTLIAKRQTKDAPYNATYDIFYYP